MNTPKHIENPNSPHDEIPPEEQLQQTTPWIPHNSVVTHENIMGGIENNKNEI